MPVARVAAALWRHAAMALLLVVAAVVYAPTQDAYGMLMWDEAQYASLARSLVRGDGYCIAGEPEGLRPPLLPLSLVANLWVSGRADDAALHRVTLAWALLALAIVYAAGTCAYGRTTGLAAAALLGSMPWFWGATANVLSELPLLACFAAALACWACGLWRDARWFVAAWGWIGLACLARYTGLLLGPLLLLATLSAVAAGDATVRRRIVSLRFLLAPLAGLIVVAPWLVHQAIVWGDPWGGFRQASTQLQVYLPQVAMPWWTYVTGLPAMLSWPIVVLLAAGTLWAMRRRDRCGLLCVLVVSFVLVWLSAYRYKEPRLVSAMLPAAALLAAVGLTRGLFGIAPRSAVIGIVAAIGLFSYGEMQPRFATVRALGYPSFRDAMQFVREHSAPDGLVIGPNPPQIFWYADRPVKDFPPAAELPGLAARAEWVVITSFERGQTAYARSLAEQLPAEALADGSAVRFADDRFWTLVVRADRLPALR